MIEPHGSAGRLGRAPRRQRVVDDGEAPRPVGFAPDDAAQRGHQAKQAKPTSLKHPVVGRQPSRGVNARTARVTCPPWASTAPIISSAMVLRAGPGTDSTISRTHADSVGGSRFRVVVPWRRPAFGQTPTTWSRVTGDASPNPSGASGPVRTRNSSKRFGGSFFRVLLAPLK